MESVSFFYNVSKFNDIFNKLDISAGELKRDVLDYAYLVEIPEKDLKGLKAELNNKLIEINYDISILLKSYKEIKTARQDAFEKQMGGEEIKKFGRQREGHAYRYSLISSLKALLLFHACCVPI